MKFTLWRFGSYWHARLDVGSYRFVHFSEAPRGARASVFLQAQAKIGEQYKLFKNEPHCSHPNCYKPDLPF